MEGIYLVVPDSKSAVGALHTHHEGGHCGEGIHHMYAQTLDSKRLAPGAAIKIVVTPSHRVTAIYAQVDMVTTEKRQADLTWMLCRPYAFFPPLKFWDHCQLAPTKPARLVARAGGNPPGCTTGSDGDLTTSHALACFWTGSPVTSSGTWWLSNAQLPHHDGVSRALRAQECPAVHVVHAMWQQPGNGPSPMGMPGGAP